MNGRYEYEKGTWIEPEELCYPHGGMNRRAKVLFPDGKLRIVRCGIPDTFFSIPVRRDRGLDGFLMMDDEGALVFCPHSKNEEEIEK